MAAARVATAAVAAAALSAMLLMCTLESFAAPDQTTKATADVDTQAVFADPGNSSNANPNTSSNANPSSKADPSASPNTNTSISVDDATEKSKLKWVEENLDSSNDTEIALAAMGRPCTFQCNPRQWEWGQCSYCGCHTTGRCLWNNGACYQNCRCYTCRPTWPSPLRYG